MSERNSADHWTMGLGGAQRLSPAVDWAKGMPKNALTDSVPFDGFPVTSTSRPHTSPLVVWTVGVEHFASAAAVSLEEASSAFGAANGDSNSARDAQRTMYKRRMIGSWCKGPTLDVTLNAHERKNRYSDAIGTCKRTCGALASRLGNPKGTSVVATPRCKCPFATRGQLPCVQRASHGPHFPYTF